MSTTKSPAPPPEKRLGSLVALLLVAAVLWTFREAPGFGFAALMDDDTNILFNPHLGALDGARLTWMFTDIAYVGRYLPLGWLSFDLVMGEAISPRGCHLAIVCFHALNALLVFWCVQRVLARFANCATARDRTLAAGAAALLWALHPLRVESAVWCSGLLYVQGGFFVLVATYARLRELESRCAGAAAAGRAWFALGLASLVISLLTYPVALFLPAVFAVLDYAWLKNTPTPAATGVRRGLIGGLLIFVVLSALGLAATLAARQHIQNSPPTLEQFGLLARALQAFYVWAAYLWRTVWPVGLMPVVEALFEIHAGDVRIWGAPLTLLFISALAWRWRRTAPYVGACWVAYLVFMIPVLGLNQHPHTASDRYSYLASVLFSTVLALGLLRLTAPPVRTAALAACAFLAVLFSGLSFRQARVWRDATTLHEYVLTHLRDPDLRSITAIRLAKLQFLAGEVRGGREAAEKIFSRASNIAGVAYAWREMAPAQPLAPDVAQRRLQEWPAAPWACLHLRIADGQLHEGRARDALARLNAALELAPDFVEARFRRALVLAMLDQPRAAAHDWLAVRDRADRRAIAPGGLEFAAGEIAKACDRAGESQLAAALRRQGGAAK